jgi:YidC/Oxa1 family membrane protein insertase
MEKRLLIAIVLSFAFLLAWSHFVGKYSPPSKVSPATPIVSDPLQQEPQQEPLFASAEETRSTFELDHTSLIFNEPSATLAEVVFPQFQDHALILEKGLQLPGIATEFLRQVSGNKEITYVASWDDKKIIKRLSKRERAYLWDLEITVQNTSNENISFGLPLVLGTLGPSIQRKPAEQFQDICISQKLKVEYPNIKKEAGFSEIEFVSLRDQYFVLIVQPEKGDYSAAISKYGAGQSLLSIRSSELVIAPGQEIKEKFLIYMGPQDAKILSSISPDWNSIIFYGKFDFIAKLLAKTLDFFYGITKNWGWSIILFSLAIYLLLFPLSIKQMVSMKKMQELQPQMHELESKYKNNPQKLNLERMELFKQNKVNPLGGCLPMLLQLPIFLKLYLVLTRSIYLKGADFLWIKDLSRPDRLVKMFHVEHFGEWQYLNILPVLIGIAMFVQQRTSTVQMGGASAEQQKMMMVIMPVMMVFVFYNMPSGLVLYWLINNLLSLGYQVKILNKK